MGNTDLTKYRTRDGTGAPGTGKVLDNLGWNTDPLKWWAWKRGKEGIRLDAPSEEKNIGRLAHDIIEKQLRDELGPEEYGDEENPAVLRSVQGFNTWKRNYRVEVTEVETILVSEEHRFSCRLDIVARVEGQRTIIDIKTGKGIYDEHWMQLAAHLRAWDENFPDDIVLGGTHVINLHKLTGGFNHAWRPGNLDWEWQVFKQCLALYWLKKERP